MKMNEKMTTMTTVMLVIIIVIFTEDPQGFKQFPNSFVENW